MGAKRVLPQPSANVKKRAEWRASDRDCGSERVCGQEVPLPRSGRQLRHAVRRIEPRHAFSGQRALPVSLEGHIAPEEPREFAEGDDIPAIGQGRLDLIGEIDCRLVDRKSVV